VLGNREVGTVAVDRVAVERRVLVLERLDLEQGLDLSVIAHRRAAVVDLHPNPGITVQPGDQICVFASLDVLARLGQMNQSDG